MKFRTLLPVSIVFFWFLFWGMSPLMAQTAETDLQVKIQTENVWKLPAAGSSAMVPFTVEITNLSEKAMRFPLYGATKVSLTDDTGKPVPVEAVAAPLSGRNANSEEVAPGSSFTYKYQAAIIFDRYQNLLLVLRDQFGNTDQIGPLSKGGYQVSLKYRNPSLPATEKGVWSGTAEVAPVSIKID